MQGNYKVNVLAQPNLITGGFDKLLSGGQEVAVGMVFAKGIVPKLVFGGASATYTQTGTTITVTKTAHGLTNVLNGAQVHLTQGTGALLTGWFDGFAYVDANTFTCTSPISQTTSGNLGSNTTETTVVSDLITGGRLGATGQCEMRVAITTNSTANNKSIRAKLATWQFWEHNLATSTQHTINVGFANHSASEQSTMCTSFGSGLGSTTAAIPKGAVDTTVSQSVTITVQLANAGDWCAVWGHRGIIYR